MHMYVAALFGLLALGVCDELIVTDEAWFEVEVKDLDGPGINYRGQFTVALFGEVAPVTVMNFVSLTKGYKKGRTTLHYKNTPIHRIVQDLVIQMGDVTNGDGTGGQSIFGETFNDEDFTLGHRSAGWVAMANQGKDTNGSQFYITLVPSRWMDGAHVVFGKVIGGFDVIETLGDVPTNKDNAFPKNRIRIVDCGVNEIARRYELKEDQMDAREDL